MVAIVRRTIGLRPTLQPQPRAAQAPASIGLRSPAMTSFPWNNSASTSPRSNSLTNRRAPTVELRVGQLSPVGTSRRIRRCDGLVRGPSEPFLMTAKELYREGKLTAAIQALGAELRDNPTDAQRRTFLFELLCFAGEYD